MHSNNDVPRLVVTGVASVSGLGSSNESVWSTAMNAPPAAKKKDYFINDVFLGSYYVQPAEFMDPANVGIGKQLLFEMREWCENHRTKDLDALLTIAKSALDDSSLNVDERVVGLVLTHENPGLDEFHEDVIAESYRYFKENGFACEGIKEYFDSFFNSFFKRGYNLQTFMYVYQIAKALNIHGYSVFVNNACASGIYAIEEAAQIIKSGKCSAVVVAGADSSSAFKQMWLSRINMYSPDGRIRPFSKDRSGFIIGEGAAALVLETLDSAKDRGANIYAEYLSSGFDLEGWKVSVPDITSSSYTTCIQRALTKAHLTMREIDLVVPHGVGTLIADAYEAKSISSLLDKNQKQPTITALKPYVGHNLGSAALLEIVLSLLIMKHQIVLPTLNYEADENIKIQLLKKIEPMNVDTILKTACAFAGFNAAAIFKRVKEFPGD